MPIEVYFMAKHRAGDRRIISISIPEDLAKKLDRKVGKGRAEGRSATVARLIQQGLEGQTPPRPESSGESRRAKAAEGDVISSSLPHKTSSTATSTTTFPCASGKREAVRSPT